MLLLLEEFGLILIMLSFGCKLIGISIVYTIGPTSLDEYETIWSTIQVLWFYWFYCVTSTSLRKTLCWCNWPGSASTAARNDVPRLRVDFWRSVWRDPKGSQTKICRPLRKQLHKAMVVRDWEFVMSLHLICHTHAVGPDSYLKNYSNLTKTRRLKKWITNFGRWTIWFPWCSHHIPTMSHDYCSYSPMDLMGSVVILCAVQLMWLVGLSISAFGSSFWRYVIFAALAATLDVWARVDLLVENLNPNRRFRFGNPERSGLQLRQSKEIAGVPLNIRLWLYRHHCLCVWRQTLHDPSFSEWPIQWTSLPWMACVPPLTPTRNYFEHSRYTKLIKINQHIWDYV